MPILNFAMEFHDSRLLDMKQEKDGVGFALFHANVCRSEGTPFKDVQESGWQNVRFSFEGMLIEGMIERFDEYAADGELWVDGVNEQGCATLPANHTGKICMELSLSPSFEKIRIHCVSIRSSFEGDFVLETVWLTEGMN